MGVPVTITDNGVPVSIQGGIPASAIPFGSPGDPAGPLNAEGKVPSAQLPPLEHDIARAATEAEMLALAVTSPAICIRTDFTPPHVFYLVADPATTLGNWEDTGEFGASTANPSVTVGLTAKNGTADTIMRSDAAPALDQAIAPTWTEAHTFTKDVIGQSHVAATNAAASAPGALGSSVQMFTSNNVSTVAHVNSLNSANNRIAYSQWDNAATYTIAGFANDGFSNFISALKVIGGHNVGITGMQSNSGSGGWDHSGSFQANGITSFTFNGNGIALGGAAQGATPSISSMGADANVSLDITTKGSGGINLQRNTAVTGTFSTSGAVTFGGNLSVSGTSAFAGNAYVGGNLGSAANTSAPSPTNSGISLGGAPTWAMLQMYDQALTANNRSADLLFISNSIKFRFANDARNAFLDVFSINGGQALGVTGITSTSGSGIWQHTGPLRTTGTVTALPSGGNGIDITGTNSTGVPSIAALGAATNVSLDISAKGSSGINLKSPTAVTGTFSVTTGATARLTVTDAGDLQAWAGYVPATPQSLTTVADLPLKASDGKTAQAANINEPTLYAVPTSGFYRVSCFIVVTQAATTSSTMPSVNISFTDPTTSTALSDILTTTDAGNTVGLHAGGSVVIAAKDGTNIGYVTSGYASSGATPMQYEVTMKVEFLG